MNKDQELKDFSKKRDGGPAFPIPEDRTHFTWNGMTLRDYFAAAAMQGWLASYGEKEQHPVSVAIADEVADQSYGMADAMLRARGAV
mgnify:CR=1 FL=1